MLSLLCLKSFNLNVIVLKINFSQSWTQYLANKKIKIFPFQWMCYSVSENRARKVYINLHMMVRNTSNESIFRTFSPPTILSAYAYFNHILTPIIP